MSRFTCSLAEVRQLAKVYQQRIPPSYLDENAHVNVQHYVSLVERGLGAIFDKVGLGDVYAAADEYGNFALEQHIRYLDEILVDEVVCVHIRLIALTPKRDMRARRGAPFPAQAKARLFHGLSRQRNAGYAGVDGRGGDDEYRYAGATRRAFSGAGKSPAGRAIGAAPSAGMGGASLRRDARLMAQLGSNSCAISQRCSERAKTRLPAGLRCMSSA